MQAFHRRVPKAIAGRYGDSISERSGGSTLANRLWKSAGTAPWYSTTCPTVGQPVSTGLAEMPQADSSAVATINQTQTQTCASASAIAFAQPALRPIVATDDRIDSVICKANVLYFPYTRSTPWSTGKQLCGETDQTSCAALPDSTAYRLAGAFRIGQPRGCEVTLAAQSVSLAL